MGIMIMIVTRMILFFQRALCYEIQNQGSERAACFFLMMRIKLVNLSNDQDDNNEHDNNLIMKIKKSK